MVSMGGFKGQSMSRARVRRVFTFGSVHRDHVTGQTLGRSYVVIEGESGEHCRATMLNHFGTAWAFQYPDENAAGVERFGLIEYPRSAWPESADRFYVGADGVLRDREFGSADSVPETSSAGTLPEVPADLDSAGSVEHVGPEQRAVVEP